MKILYHATRDFAIEKREGSGGHTNMVILMWVAPAILSTGWGGIAD